MTNVDHCEQQPDECNRINFEAVQLLFHAAQKINAHFQLLSTDFVFDGEKGNYKEEDQVNPLSLYAQSKVNAENYLLASNSLNWSIVRTIIVYGTANNLSRNNIIYWAKEALEKGQELSIIDDQFRAPTWANDLAWACIRICELNKMGIYHISGPETFSIYEIVEKIAQFFNLPTNSLSKSSSLNLNQPAKRPPKTGFDLTKAKTELGYKPKTLEETFSIL
jgi:dTDP-4-dehydrorhamnose reductase